jgi:hypothetical protein
MIKEFFMKKMLKAKGIPEDQANMVITLVNKNPDLFKKIAEEVQAEIKQGGDQMAVTMKVMQRHQEEIQALMGK